MRIARPLFAAVAIIAAVASSAGASAAQMGDPMMPPDAAAAVSMDGTPQGCGCRGVQQPPWHGNVRGSQCGPGPACCPGSSVFQAHPFQQLHWRQHGCTTLPPCLPRLHAMCREGYLPSPVPPVQPRCHQCGAAIEGGF